MSKSRKEAGHSLRHTVPDTFCAAKKIVSDRATLHTQIWLWRRDSCGGERSCARRSVKRRVTYRISVHTILDSQQKL